MCVCSTQSMAFWPMNVLASNASQIILFLQKRKSKIWKFTELHYFWQILFILLFSHQNSNTLKKTGHDRSQVNINIDFVGTCILNLKSFLIDSGSIFWSSINASQISCKSTNGNNHSLISMEIVSLTCQLLTMYESSHVLCLTQGKKPYLLSFTSKTNPCLDC